MDINPHVKEPIEEVCAPGIPYGIVDEFASVHHITEMHKRSDIVFLNVWEENVVVEFQEKVIDLLAIPPSSKVSVI